MKRNGEVELRPRNTFSPMIGSIEMSIEERRDKQICPKCRLNPRHIEPSGLVSAYCKECRAEYQRQIYWKDQDVKDAEGDFVKDTPEASQSDSATVEPMTSTARTKKRAAPAPKKEKQKRRVETQTETKPRVTLGQKVLEHLEYLERQKQLDQLGLVQREQPVQIEGAHSSRSNNANHSSAGKKKSEAR